MRDYYLEFISNHGEKIQKRSDDGGTKGAEVAFVPFAPTSDGESSKKALDERSGFAMETAEEQTIIFEERVAIMMYDGGLSEVDAIEYLTLDAIDPIDQTTSCLLCVDK